MKRTKFRGMLEKLLRMFWWCGSHAADVLWKLSVQNCKMWYTLLISDGDSETFMRLSKSNAYGDKKL